MATTAAEAWDALTERAREIAQDSARDSFFLGFGEGWQAQENRPFHCAHCGYECHGVTDAETIALAREHTKTCEAHPLATEIKRLRAEIEWLRESNDGWIRSGQLYAAEAQATVAYLEAENTRLRAALEETAEGCGHTRCHAYPWIRTARKALRET